MHCFVWYACLLSSDIASFQMPFKRKRASSHGTSPSPCCILREFKPKLPALSSEDYFVKPSLCDLAAHEHSDPGYCSRVPNFIIGRHGYGWIRFFGNTDVTGLCLDRTVMFRKHEVVVYEDEKTKPLVGHGLNKAAEVSLIIERSVIAVKEGKLGMVVEKFQEITKRQGAHFISFDPETGEWKFSVLHFSRFGLSEEDEEDILLNDETMVQELSEINGGDVANAGEETMADPRSNAPLLPHSVHDPAKMKELRMLMFPIDEEEIVPDGRSQKNVVQKRECSSPAQIVSGRTSHGSSLDVVRKTPLALVGYNPNSSSPGSILMALQNNVTPLKMAGKVGFKLELMQETPVTNYHSLNVADAGLFMGRSFRVGWGPNGILAHSGAPAGTMVPHVIYSSVINLENVAFDSAVKDEDDKPRKELVDLAFVLPLNLHKEINHETREVGEGCFKLKLQKTISSCMMLPEICRSYIELIEKQLEVPRLPPYKHLVLMHQVMIWELIKVLFSERELSAPEIDPEATPLLRRAEFSYWLTESVFHRVQEEASSCNYLECIFLLLTGRQLDAAVVMAACRGDVRLACLLGQAGGSMVNRANIERQLVLWRANGLDFRFIERDRTRIYELLSGNIIDALRDMKIDWKRFLGLLMWYRLAPDTPLPLVFQAYQHLLEDGKAPFPVPTYMDEGPPLDEGVAPGGKHFDLSYYLMLLHARGKLAVGFLKNMFSALSSTQDPLDFHMIWHQRAVLEATGIVTSSELQVLDMGLVSQLLCAGQCHWAIYVALHMPYHEDLPYLHAILIREILFQYCEVWSSNESQQQFIENLNIPSEWLHEALAIYFNYNGDLLKALEYFLLCANWQRAHSIFVTSVAHCLFFSENHSEAWRIATYMENHKSEIENWDLGGGIYVSFYSIRSSFLDDGAHSSELESLERKNAVCKAFFGDLNKSIAVFGSKLPTDARVVYSKMANEISELLISAIGEGRTRDEQLSCFRTILTAPIPEDVRASHLQEAVTLFTVYLTEIASNQ